jgi:hypothetical protein
LWQPSGNTAGNYPDEVRLNEAEVSATSGQGALLGLTIGNPKGFKTDSAFRLGEISLTL